MMMMIIPSEFIINAIYEHVGRDKYHMSTVCPITVIGVFSGWYGALFVVPWHWLIRPSKMCFRWSKSWIFWWYNVVATCPANSESFL